jgi:hypothetical protein
MCETAKGASLSVLMRAFGRITGILAYSLGMPADEMLQTIIDEAKKLDERLEEGKHSLH